MLKELNKGLKHVADAIRQGRLQGRVPFDPTQFNDPVAMKTEWTPLERGGANFKTHDMKFVNDKRVEFRSSTGAKIFSTIFFIMGLGILVLFVTSLLFAKSQNGFDPGMILIPVVGLAFSAVGFALFIADRPSIFDLKMGYYWKDRKSPDGVLDKSSIRCIAAIKDIHAIQLIPEYCRGNKSGYYSFEINLVLKSGERVNVVDHGDRVKIVEQATALGRLLKVPLWNGLKV